MRTAHLSWQYACISNYLSAGLETVFVQLPTACSVYLHIWLAVSCLLSAAYVLVFFARLSCSRVFFASLLFVSQHLHLCLPVCLALCLATHRDWHLTTHPKRVAGRGLRRFSVKVSETWLTGQGAYSFRRINALEPLWQFLPTRSRKLCQKGGPGHTGLHPYVILQHTSGKAQNKPRGQLCECLLHFSPMFSENTLRVTVSDYYCLCEVFSNCLDNRWLWLTLQIKQCIFLSHCAFTTAVLTQVGLYSWQGCQHQIL